LRLPFGMCPLPWPDILRAFIRVPKRVSKALTLMALMFAFAIFLVRLEDRKREASELEVVTVQLQDCEAWASMNVKQKKRNYRADPTRWDGCLCEGESCELDRLYITGKLSR